MEEFNLDQFHGGTSWNAYKFFGCHKAADGKGYVFRVWAPHAKSVSIVGTFNGWDENAAVMNKMCDSESYEIFIRDAKAGDRYQICIFTFDGRKLLKVDPYAFCSDFPNSTSSVVYDLPVAGRYEREGNFLSVPINIFEVNLLSWKRHEDNSYLSFKELEKELVPYVCEMGYTHVEFMPVTEYPFDGSWGYQVTGYFSVTARLGTPDEFSDLIKAFHDRGIKVILDWVPAHFPKDHFGLYEFDGQPLYECPVWYKMEHSGWGTRKFDFGRGEVDSFLISSAAFFLEQYQIDGLRIDAVASMLYLDYDKKAGEWQPNVYGDNRNLEAIAFIKKLNLSLKKNFPGAMTVAEESTSFDGVTKAVEDGGLGFDFKWNMGWMNDVLFYCRQDPLFRRYHHLKLNFSMMYAFSENYILPLSHDEVVHVKGSIVNKMPGEYADKFAGERSLLGFMYAHPGKKLNFMGYEIAQFSEWNYAKGIEYFLKAYEKHAKMTDFVKALNRFYRENAPLYEIEDSWKGFEWLVVDDEINNVIAFNRYSRSGDCLTAIINFSGIDVRDYRIGIEKGRYRLSFDSDRKEYGGEGKTRKRIYKTNNIPSHGKKHSISVTIPKLTCMYLIKEKNNFLGEYKQCSEKKNASQCYSQGDREADFTR